MWIINMRLSHLISVYSLIILILCANQAVTDEDIEDLAVYSKAVNSVNFGIVGDWEQPTIEERVWHMEEDVDVPDNYFIADGSKLKMYQHTEQELTTLTNTGDFTQITGFDQMNETHILAIDSLRHCLKWIDRNTFRTTVAAGSCGSSGFANGNLRSSRFKTPHQVTIKQEQGLTYVTDTGNNAIRMLTENTVSTFVTLEDSPYGIFYGRGQDMYVTTASRVIRINTRSKTVTPIVESREVGFRDGSLRRSLLDHPYELRKVSRHVIIVADTNNNRLRVINTRSSTVSSICTSSDTSGTTIERCHLQQPLSLMKYKTGALIIGSNNTEIKLLTYVQENPRDGRKPPPPRREPEQRPPKREFDSSSEEDNGGDRGSNSGQAEMSTKTVIAVSVATTGIVLIVIIISLSCLLYRRSSNRSKENGATANLDMAVRNNSIHRNQASDPKQYKGLPSSTDENQGDLAFGWGRGAHFGWGGVPKFKLKIRESPAESGRLDVEAYSNPYDEYTEVEDPYQSLETKAPDGYTLLEMEGMKDSPLSKKSTRYGPLPHRPTSAGTETEAKVEESTQHKSADDYYYASTEDMTSDDENSGGERLPTVSKRLNLSVIRTRSANDYGYVDFEQDKNPVAEEELKQD